MHGHRHGQGKHGAGLMGGGLSNASCACSRTRPRLDLGMHKIIQSHRGVWGFHVADSLRQTLEVVNTTPLTDIEGHSLTWKIPEDPIVSLFKERLEQYRSDSSVYFTSVWSRYDVHCEAELPRIECREMIKDCLIAQKNHLPLLINGLCDDVLRAKRDSGGKLTGAESRVEISRIFDKAAQVLQESLVRTGAYVDDLFTLYQSVADEAFVHGFGIDTHTSTSQTVPTSFSRARPGSPRLSEDGDVLVSQEEFMATMEHIFDELLGIKALPARLRATINL